jgi:hypothetical protein
MRKLQLLTSVLVLVSSPMMAACYVGTAPPPPNNEVAYNDPPPPPPPQQEAPPPPPPEGQVWVPGEQHWNGHAYEWHQGHYERPPRANARHVAGHWEQHGRQKTWVDAHWE